MISLAGLVALWMAYWLRPDSMAAITFWPAWVWLPFGLALALPEWRKRRRWARLGLLVSWMMLVLVFNEEPRSLLRGLVKPRVGTDARVVRVVSLNCAAGSETAAREVLSYKPDIILLQETPKPSDVRKLAQEAFGKSGEFVCGLDCSIIARGSVDAYDMPSVRMECASARVDLEDGPLLDVASVRLIPPVFRTDIWSSDHWRSQAENRRTRREQLRDVVLELEQVASGAPLIVGGDFNAPAGDGALREMRPRLRDAFSEAGRGWGNTGINDIPVQRVDQVWVSCEVRPVSVVARKSVHSDHRMVVCDLVVE